MERSFNTAGPCFDDEHYMLSPERWLADVLGLIEREKCFVFYAGHQTGKTTSLNWLVRHLRATGHRALVIDLQTASDQDDPDKAFPLIFDAIASALRDPDGGLTATGPAETRAWLENPETALLHYLRFLAAQDPRPLVVLLNDADSLVGDTMIAFLTQLREGYIWRRQDPFPSSIVLVGMRAARDYVSRSGASSPFNIAESATLAPFTEPEVAELVNQHTEATGQRFEPEAVSRIWTLTLGHPWLVNALADESVRKQAPDRSTPVTAAHIEAAKETIIVHRRSHIDSLVARLREPRIAGILGPMLLGEQTAEDILDDDFAYAIGMGLLRLDSGEYRIANPIYREVIPRALTFIRQAQIHDNPSRYVRADGSLDMPLLMRSFQTFWRKDGHLAAEGFGYREAGPHLMLMAFLQRILNGGGRIEREYGLGRGALDLMIFWRDTPHAIEVKLRRTPETEADALDQLATYLDQSGLTEGWLVLFDLRKDRTWEEKLTLRDVTHQGKTIHIVGS